MRTILVPLVLAVATLLTAVAHADTLTITSGGAGFNPNIIGANFAGDGFSGFLIDDFGMPSLSSSSPPSGAFSMTLNFGPFWPARLASVQVGSAFCLTVGSIDTNCGSLALTTSGLAGLGATAPFTATGHLNVGDGFDLVGQGTVGAFPYCQTGPGCSNPAVLLNYTFSAPVPAPSSLLLLAAVALEVARKFIIVHRRQTVSGRRIS